MATKIVTKNSSTASAVPTASDLVQGELAVNVADKRLFTEDNGGAIVELGTNPSTIDINAGSIDGTAIGASSASTGAFTTLTATGLTVDTDTLYVDSTNNRVGIGTTSPSDTLSVNGQIGFFGNDGQLKFNDGSAIKGGNSYGDIRIQTDRFRVYNEAGSNLAMNIDSSGKVGIGTTSPDTNLEISIASSADGLLLSSTNAHTSGRLFLQNATAGEGYAILQENGGLDFRSGATAGTSSGTQRMRIDSSGNVGIGTSSPSHAIDVSTSATTWAGAIKNTDATNGFGLFLQSAESASKAILGAYSGSSYKFYVRGDGNVGIGTSSPSHNLHVSEGTEASFRIEKTGTGSSAIQITTGNNTASINSTKGGTDLTIGTSNTERMRIDSSGRVSVGTKAWITADANVGYFGGNSGQSNHISFYDSLNLCRIYTNGSERLRIDSSGNLLVGQTSQNYNVVGASLGNDGILRTCVNNGTVAAFNRKSSDGAIVGFYKNGVTVGSISTNTNSLPSDRNFKRNIKDLTLGLDFVESLNPVTYNFKIDDEGQAVMTGLIAQEVEEALTVAGVEKNSMTLLQHKPTEDVNESDYQMDYLKFVPILINSIKEQQTLIESLTSRIAALEE